jgi:hypothetical protein
MRGMGEVFYPAPWVAAQVRDELARGNMDDADRLISEAASRLMLAAGEIPEAVLGRPGPTGSRPHDVLIASIWQYALERRGEQPRSWMTAVEPLPQPWLWDGDDVASPEWRAHVTARTPALFRARGLLLREADLISP